MNWRTLKKTYDVCNKAKGSLNNRKVTVYAVFTYTTV